VGEVDQTTNSPEKAIGGATIGKKWGVRKGRGGEQTQRGKIGGEETKRTGGTITKRSDELKRGQRLEGGKTSESQTAEKSAGLGGYEHRGGVGEKKTGGGGGGGFVWGGGGKSGGGGGGGGKRLPHHKMSYNWREIPSDLKSEG